MKDLIEIKAYKCRWCGKAFQNNRHDCKFDPDKTNCLSCKKCKGVDKEDGSRYFVCADDIQPSLPDVSFGVYADFREKNRHYKMNCESYEPLENYEGSKSYAEHLQEIETQKFMEKFGGAIW